MALLDDLIAPSHAASIEALAKAHGITPAQARAVVGAVLPELSRRMERNTLSRGGLADLVQLIGAAEQTGTIADPARLASPDVQQQGIRILDQVLGSKDRSRAVAARAASASGLSDVLIRTMLPGIAAMVMGAIARSASGGLGDILARFPGLGGGGTSQTGSGGGLPMPDMRLPEMPAPGSLPDIGGGMGGGARTGGGFGGGQGQGFPLPLPGGFPQDGGGFPQQGGGYGRTGGSQSPLPIPGEVPGGGNNPYGDLSDIIRRGGGVAAGGALWGIVRSILGGILGFQSRGLMGWILRVVVARWGWSLLKLFLGRLIFRR